jgi:hypothetical protein
MRRQSPALYPPAADYKTEARPAHACLMGTLLGERLTRNRFGGSDW